LPKHILPIRVKVHILTSNFCAKRGIYPYWQNMRDPKNIEREEN